MNSWVVTGNHTQKGKAAVDAFSGVLLSRYVASPAETDLFCG